MEQVNYQSHEQYDGFNPVERTNAIPALDRRNALLRQGEERYLAGLQRNTQTNRRGNV